MRNTFAILLTTILVCLASCVRESGVSVRLDEANELMITAPDSALAMLRGMKKDVEEENDEWTNNRYKLLLIKAWNKIGSPSDQSIFPMMDSVIFDLVDYMEQSPDQSLLPETYFQGGRVFSEEGKAEKALLYYKMAQLCDSTYIDSYLMSRILAQTGYIYLRYGLLDEAIDMQETAREYCRMAGDTLGVRYCTEDIATISQMRDTFRIEPSKLANNRYTVRAVNDKARYSMLKQKKDRLAEGGSEGHDLLPSVFLAVFTCIVLYLIYKIRMTRRKAKAEDKRDEEKVEEEPVANHSPIMKPENVEKHRFYDAEVSELISTRLRSDKTLRSADWQFIESRLLESFPNFRTSLYSLFNLSDTEYHISLLIKMETPPSQIAHLLAIGNSSVSQSRLRMIQKAGREEGTAKDWDNLVLSLPPVIN